MWASWIFLASVEGLCGVWVYLKDLSPPPSVSFSKKCSFSQLFKLLYKFLLLPKYRISVLHTYIFTRLLFAGMKYLPSGFFSFTTCSLHVSFQHSWVMWQQQKNPHRRAGRRKRSKECITGIANCDNNIQEKFDRSATLLSLCWPTYRKCEDVLRNKEQGLLGRASIRTIIVMFLMWLY